MIVNNQTRREVMELAWDLFRSALGTADARSFADALKGAWRYMKKMATWQPPKWARGSGARTVQLSPTLYRSPIARALQGQAYASNKAHKAAYMTARLGY
ncbi:MAG: hypothetical protein PSX79_13285 [bacterium]|nr:hypothetical protein [bacterium]